MSCYVILYLLSKLFNKCNMTETMNHKKKLIFEIFVVYKNTRFSFQVGIAKICHNIILTFREHFQFTYQEETI